MSAEGAVGAAQQCPLGGCGRGRGGPEAERGPICACGASASVGCRRVAPLRATSRARARDRNTRVDLIERICRMMTIDIYSNAVEPMIHLIHRPYHPWMFAATCVAWWCAISACTSRTRPIVAGLRELNLARCLLSLPVGPHMNVCAAAASATITWPSEESPRLGGRRWSRSSPQHAAMGTRAVGHSANGTLGYSRRGSSRALGRGFSRAHTPARWALVTGHPGQVGVRAVEHGRAVPSHLESGLALLTAPRQVERGHCSKAGARKPRG